MTTPTADPVVTPAGITDRPTTGTPIDFLAMGSGHRVLSLNWTVNNTGLIAGCWGLSW